MSTLPSTTALAMTPPEDLTWLLEMLRSVQLEQFFARIRDQLQVSRLEHFEYVNTEDLEKVRLKKIFFLPETIS